MFAQTEGVRHRVLPLVFLIQPFDYPERMIGADPVYYLHHKLGSWGTGTAHFDPRAMAEYERCFRDPATIRATCEDYRAAASIDLAHDAEDADRRVECPLLVLWGRRASCTACSTRSPTGAPSRVR